MDASKNPEEFVISWNNRFIYDRLYRKKYNIPFGSKQHLETNQIDIYLDLLEDYMFKRLTEEHEEREKLLLDYKKTGNFLRDDIVNHDEDEELISKLKFGSNVREENNV